MADKTEEPEAVQNFKTWFKAGGGLFHPHARYTSVKSGYSITTTCILEPDTVIVSCPFSLVIQLQLARGALSQILGGHEMLKNWSERQIVCCYIVFHWIVELSKFPCLAHMPYINTLPDPSLLRTPLYFTNAEVDTLRGSNMYGATVDRQKKWEEEWGYCRSNLRMVRTDWAEAFTWERYLAASTYLSSRAFPSTLLSPSPSLLQTEDSHPVLIPGVDTLNHARAHPVSWLVQASSSAVTGTEMSICIQTHKLLSAGAEIFNNYGPKPNAELLLGYGFTLPNNPDDTIVLKLGGADGKKWEVGREAHNIEGLWAEIVDAVKTRQSGEDEDQVEDGEAPAWSDTLDASDVLESMTTAKLERLPVIERAQNLRSDVAEMLSHYIEGQKDILAGIVAYAHQRQAEALVLAKEDGVEMQIE